MYSRILVIVVIMTILVPFEVFAGTATQTDWSGGDGVWGPVFDWADEFYMGTDIECYTDPLNIALLNTPLEHTVDGDFDGANSVYFADINGDGYMDILGAGYYADDITWWENIDGSGTSWTEHIVDADFNGAYSVHSADIDGDGDMDILGASWWDDEITWWENMDGSGTSWTDHIVAGSYPHAMLVFSADIDSDGDMDVLGAASTSSDFIWFENVGGSGTSWVEHIFDTNFNGARSVYSEDIDDDGDMDILGAGQGDIIWWENLNSIGTNWTKHIAGGDFPGALSVYSTDVNGDGYMDIVGAAADFGGIRWWENVDGSGTSWSEHIIDVDFDGRSAYSADVDGDGYMDILGAAYGDNEITWWENVDGSGTSWIDHVVDGDFDGAYSVFSTDINGDSCLDILGAAHEADDITWWDLNAFLPDGSLESSVLDVQESPDWQIIDWACTEPSGTSVALQVRASDNSSSMGAWSDTLTAPCTLEGIVADQDQYFQYRAILNTTDSYSTPVLHDVTVVWQPFTGTQEGSAGEVTSYALYGAQPNPALGHAALLFALPVNSLAELTIYDLTGRVIHSFSRDYEAGVHEVILDALVSGMYMVRMTSGEFTAIQHFVVID